MIIAYLLTGMVVGTLLAAIGLIAGNPLWSIVLLYSFGGSLAILGLAGLTCFQRRAPDSADAIGTTSRDTVKA